MAADLARRDFAINAMASSLHQRRFGELLDTEGGVADLDAGVVRVLHRASFRDDPTRTFRAARYVSRLGFRLDAATRRQLRRGLLYMDALSAARVRREIERLLVRAARGPRHAHGGAARRVARRRGRTRRAGSPRSAEARRRSRPAWAGAARRADLSPVRRERADAFRERIGAGKRQAQVMRAVVRLREAEQALSEARRPSEASAIVGNAPREAVEAASAAAASASARRNLARYLDASRRRSPLDGHDLLALGVPPGPAVGAMLSVLRNADLDGVVRGRAQAERFVRDRLGTEGRSPLPL